MSSRSSFPYFVEDEARNYKGEFESNLGPETRNLAKPIIIIEEWHEQRLRSVSVEVDDN